MLTLDDISIKILQNWLRLFSEPVADRISNLSELPLTEQAMDDINETLIRRLFNVSSAILIKHCLREARTITKASILGLDFMTVEDRSKAATNTVEKLMEMGASAFDDEAPLLRPRMENICQEFQDAYIEMLERISSAKAAICDKLLLGENFTQVLGISSDGADSHNYGRATSIINTESGKFLYKPHDVRQDAWGYDLLKRIECDNIKIPRAITYYDGDIDMHYGFCEFISSEPANTTEEAKKYYYNLGAFTAFTHAIGSTDMHYENLLSQDSMPVPVDNETLLSTMVKSDIDNGSFDNQMLMVITNGMFPCRLSKVREISPLVGLDTSNVSAPVIDGIKVSVFGFLDEFYQGFLDTYRLLLTKKAQILDSLKSCTDFAIRTVLRPTQYYSKTLMNLTKIELLQDKTQAESKLREWMEHNPYQVADSLWEKVRNSELKAMRHGNIPYFFVKADSKSLYDVDGLVAEDLFAYSPVKNAINRINRFSEEDLAFQLKLMHDVLDNSLIPLDEGKPITPDMKFRGQPDKVVKHIFDGVLQSGNDLIWMHNLNNSYRIPMIVNYYSGLLGLLIVLTIYDKRFPASSYWGQIETLKTQCLKMTQIYINKMQDLRLEYPWFNIALDKGAAGILRALTTIYQYDKNQDIYNCARSIVSLMACTKLDGIKLCRRRDGLAGALESLCLAKEDFDIDNAVIKKYADEIIKRRTYTVEESEDLLWAPDGIRASSGMDLGMAGIAKALYMAARVLDSQELRGAAMAAAAYERDKYDISRGGFPDTSKSTVCPSYGGAFHSGNTGLGFLGLYLGDESLLEDAISGILSNPPSFSDRLMDGNLGTIDFLIEASLHLGDPELMTKARELLATIENRTMHFADPEFHQVYEPTLFGGEAGYLYILMRIQNPQEVPCLLA